VEAVSQEGRSYLGIRLPRREDFSPQLYSASSRAKVGVGGREEGEKKTVCGGESAAAILSRVVYHRITE